MPLGKWPAGRCEARAGHAARPPGCVCERDTGVGGGVHRGESVGGVPVGDGAVSGYMVGSEVFRSQEVTRTPAERLESIPETTAAERAVADLMPIDVPRQEARTALERVPLWFHTCGVSI